MKSRSRWSTMVLAGALAACAGDVPMAASTTTATAELGAKRIGILSRNLYVGADLTQPISALASPSPDDDIPAIIATVNVINSTDWPARAQALVGEIAGTRPAIIGLQEVWTVRVNLTPIGIPVATDLDFLASMEAGIAAAGLPYKVVATVTSTDASPNPLVRVRDQDVLLVDTTRVSVIAGSVDSRVFAYNVGPIAPNVSLLRGWVRVQAIVDGVEMTIASTHLESGVSPAFTSLRAAQAFELVASLGTSTPAVLLGDLNDIEGSPMYNIIAAAGFRDAWREMRPESEGFTCCHAEDLTNETASESFNQRIDYVFARGLQFRNDRLLGTIHLLGLHESERIGGALWPSDHAGVLTTLLLPPAH
jgi:hypothetical protein